MSANDIVVRAEYAENDTGRKESEKAKATAVKVCVDANSSGPPALYSHNSNTGAGNSVPVGYGNRIGNGDFIGVQLGVPPASDGGYSVMIPLFWMTSDGNYSTDFAYKRQSVSVTADGETTVRKGTLLAVRRVNE